MRILVASTAGVGHFRPLLPYVASCVAAGHDVAVAAPRSFADHVAQTGHRFLPLDDVSSAALAAAHAEANSDPAAADRYGLRIFADLAPRAALSGMMAAVDAYRPDLVLRDAAELSSLVVAEARGVPQVTVQFTLHRRLRAALAGAVPLLAPLRPLAGLPQMPHEDVARGVATLPAVSLLPESFDPADGSAVVHRFRPAEEPHTPDVTAGPPLVYLSFGTVTPSMPAAATALRAAATAIAELPVRLLVSIGRQVDAGDWPNLGAHVRVQSWVDETRVLPGAAAVVCHGGAGTTLAALTAGVPIVVVPQFGDQPAIGDAVQACGVGLRATGAGPGAPPTAADIRRAVQRLLSEPAFRSRTAAIAGDIAALPTTAAAVELFARVAAR